MENDEIKTVAREVFEVEARSIDNLKDLLDEDFPRAVRAIADSPGKVIVTGIGKSGHVGRKIAATLASTGTPSFFVHPAEAFHGDLGMFGPHDIVIALSRSGKSDEVLRLIPFFKENGNAIVAVTGNPDSTLARNSDFHLNVHVEKEACPLEMAPTSSTAAALAMGDAVAVALMKVRDFNYEHFARFHPGGSLGRRLLTRAEDIMRREHLPVIAQDCSMIELIHVMTRGRLGLALIADDDENIVGIITDGDLRRAMERNEERFFSRVAGDIMTREPKSVAPDTRLLDLERIMRRHKIKSLLVLDGRKLLGVVEIYDIE